MSDKLHSKKKGDTGPAAGSEAPNATPKTKSTRKITMGGREFSLPHSRSARLGLGVAFVIGGLLGFLPIVGFWMLPLGLFILSIDLPFARRWRRRFVVWWSRRRNKDKQDGG